ncbi:hypothetical protein F5Y03DRAFT_225552 [Xylaria venustula]|nr:hypothetical protein F5Y03DRAFT_225552 [Xylaria venustula]
MLHVRLLSHYPDRRLSSRTPSPLGTYLLTDRVFLPPSLFTTGTYLPYSTPSKTVGRYLPSVLVWGTSATAPSLLSLSHPSLLSRPDARLTLWLLLLSSISAPKPALARRSAFRSPPGPLSFGSLSSLIALCACHGHSTWTELGGPDYTTCLGSPHPLLACPKTPSTGTQRLHATPSVFDNIARSLARCRGTVLYLRYATQTGQGQGQGQNLDRTWTEPRCTICWLVECPDVLPIICCVDTAHSTQHIAYGIRLRLGWSRLERPS